MSTSFGHGLLAGIYSDYDARESGSSLAEELAIARHNLVLAAIAERKAVSPKGDGVVAYDREKGEFFPVWFIGKPNGKDFADENASKAREAQEDKSAAYWASIRSESKFDMGSLFKEREENLASKAASKAARKAGKMQPEARCNKGSYKS